MPRSTPAVRAAAATLLALSLAAAPGCRAPAEETVPAPAVEPPPPVLTATGETLGPLSAATPFDPAEISALFPGATVAGSFGSTEGEAYRILSVESDTFRLLIRESIGAGTIHSVEVLEGTAVEGLEVTHGHLFADAFPAGSVPECQPGVEESSGKVICAAPGVERWTLIFGGSWDGPDGTLPPPEALRDWAVERLFWRP